MNYRNDIQGFNQREGRKSMKCGQFLKFPTHGLLSNLLFQYFYRILDSVNKGVVDQFVREEIMSQSFEEYDQNK